MEDLIKHIRVLTDYNHISLDDIVNNPYMLQEFKESFIFVDKAFSLITLLCKHKTLRKQIQS